MNNIDIDYLIEKKENFKKLMAATCEFADVLDKQIKNTDAAIDEYLQHEMQNMTEL